ncbi:MAG: molybdopterin molybdotransferase MoeA [Nitrospirales bacterium]|nr:molybdopterin molybdotransferase MoeA [Nitrospirales bacterium]
MLNKNYILPTEALERVLSALASRPFSRERMPIDDACGRVTASDLCSAEDLPTFSRSTVDGYAVQSLDTFGARDTSPAYLTLSQDILMGTDAGFLLRRGEVARIPTGGMLPQGADAVVMFEHAQEISGGIIEVMRSVAPGENVIRKGEDIRRGDPVITKGLRLRPQEIGALAGVGIAEVEVYRRPVVSIISTGDEIVPVASPLGPGQVRDINSYTLSGLIREAGGIPRKWGIIRDDYELIRDVVEQAWKETDLVLITGGTSAGLKDMTADVINSLGAPGVLFHGVSMKPGKPMLAGVVDGRPIMGLPGHPAAVMVCFDVFVRPVLERLSGLAGRLLLRTAMAKMAKGVSSSSGREDHIRVGLEQREDGFYAVPVLGKSGLIATLVRADGIVVIPPHRPGLDAGEEVRIHLF